MRRKIVSCGFVLPCAREVSTASTVRPWCATNSSRSRAVFESRPSFSPAAAQRVEHGQRVVVQLEVVRVRPRTLHLDGRAVRVARPAHPLDDPLGEEHPDLLVVVELGMTLQRRERRAPSLVVARRVELEPVALPETHVPLRAEVGRPVSRS